MAVTDQQRTPLPVPYAMESRTASRRSATSTRTSTPWRSSTSGRGTWQMACRLEEIPNARDFVEYEFLDQSVVVVRTEDLGVTAFQNVVVTGA